MFSLRHPARDLAAHDPNAISRVVSVKGKGGGRGLSRRLLLLIAELLVRQGTLGSASFLNGASSHFATRSNAEVYQMT